MIIEDYLQKIQQVLRSVADLNAEPFETAAETIASAYAKGKTIYVFGCTHSAILAEDVFYRAGAPAFWRPLWGPGLSIAATPGFLTTAMEHSLELGEAVVANSQISKGDVITIISTSGKNAAPVAVAERSLERGAKVILVCSSFYRNERGNHPRHPSLWSFKDQAILLDNRVPCGDSSFEIAGCPMGPLSTIAGSFIMHTLSAKAVEKIAASGLVPPVFKSSNAPGGAEFNWELLARPGMKETSMLP